MTQLNHMVRARPMTSAQRCASFATPDPEPHRVVLPAQEWVRMAGAYCGDRLAEADGKSIVGVRAIDHQGYLHAIFSVLHGGYSGDYRAEGYRLVPPEMFEGDTVEFIDWRDAPAIHARRRGDSTGLLVKVQGKILVCAKAVHFVRDLPTVPPLSVQEAKAHDEQSRSAGWRAMGFRGASISWRAVNGHPVVIYEHPLEMKRMAILFWRANGEVQEYVLHKSLEASMFTAPVDTAAQKALVQEAPVQMGLF
ncbi:hypothetical protein [Acidovorax sp. sic0104]|uniref:hypothetical protein n=1 Tax=Acidovorax sp. sic0104 TaxID=2854784 RepID=UPI001C469166|nr:hypothetical protein [Acidovorax sp. sic0104]MBV7542168.1 hypothetical protein [Acidovorax sp. sic0104]